MSTMNRNTITRQITTTEERIRKLMNELEDSDNSSYELTRCQTEVDKLFGKLSDNNSVLTADVQEMLSNLRAGKVSPDELEKLLVGEREKVSYSLKLADDAKKNLEDVMAFVQHFVLDVEKGRPIPKESFQSLFYELDTIADSMNSMAKVHRSKDIEKLKNIMQAHLDDKKALRKIEGVVSLKNILSENNREAKDRQRKQNEVNHSRKSIANIGSLSRPKSSQNHTEGGINPRAGSPGKTDVLSLSGPLRNVSPPPLRRTGTSGSLGGSGSMGNLNSARGPPSPGRITVGMDKMSTQWSSDECDIDGNLALKGRTTILKPEVKTKRQGKRDKRLSSAVIYAHTDDDACSVGSGGGGGGLGNSFPMPLAEFIPPDAKKLQVSQSVQTDDFAIDFNQSSIDLSASEMIDVEDQDGKKRLGSSSSSGRKSPAKRKSNQGKKDGKAISMVSARRSSRDNSKTKSSLMSSSVDLTSSSSATGVSSTKQKEEKDTQHDKLRQSRYSTDSATQDFFKNYVDNDSCGDNLDTAVNTGKGGNLSESIREMQDQEKEKVASMSTGEVQEYLKKKEKRLIMLEAKLKQQESDMTAVINVKVAEEVSKAQKKQIATKPKPLSTAKNAQEKDNNVTIPDISSTGQMNVAEATTSQQVDNRTGQPETVKPNSRDQTTSKLKSQSSVVSVAGTLPGTTAVSTASGNNTSSKKTHESGKRPGPRVSFSKKSVRSRAQEPLSIDKIVEKIIKFLPKPEADGGKHSKIPVHNISMNMGSVTGSIDDSEDGLKLPAINNPSSRKAAPSIDHNKVNRAQEDKVQVSDPSTLAVAGVRVTNSIEYQVDDDAMSVLSNGSQDNSTVQRMCKSPVQSPELVNDIWIPPPGNLNKKIFNTICIFPLHTVDQSTSTDDLNPIAEGPLPVTTTSPHVHVDAGITEAKKEKTVEITPPETISNESSTATAPQILPVCLSNVAAVSRPPTGGEGDTIIISKKITAGGVPKTSARGADDTIDNSKLPSGPVTLGEVTQELKKSGLKGNPLLQLYLFFYKDLDVQCRHHLLAAASGVSMDASRYTSTDGYKGTPYAVESLQGMSDMFEVVAEEVSKLEYTTYYAMQALLQTDHTINDLVLIANSGDELSDSFYFHLKEASSKLGEIKIAETWVNMLLHDSRAIFTRTRALGIDPVLIGPQFSIAYQAFLSCQGSNLQLKKKLDEVHALMQKYLAKPVFHVQTMPVADTSGIEKYCEQLKERCEDLEEAMEDIRDENEELREELTLIDSQLDRTPGALLFYAVLHSPKLPEIVANHIQILQAVKTTIEGSEHFDFITLKRRLEKCLQGLPAMQQFFKKYSTLHKKWAAARSKMFLDRRQIGGDADNHYVCPICNIDSRLAEVDIGCPLVNTASKNSSSTGALATVTKMKGSKRGKSSASPGGSHFGGQF